jgi:hypothetical protein
MISKLRHRHARPTRHATPTMRYISTIATVTSTGEDQRWWNVSTAHVTPRHRQRQLLQRRTHTQHKRRRSAQRGTVCAYLCP